MSLWNIVYGGSATRARSSETLLANVMATRNATFHDKYRREQVAKGSKGGAISFERTRLRSQEGMGQRTWGYRRSRPLRNLETIG